MSRTTRFGFYIILNLILFSIIDVSDTTVLFTYNVMVVIAAIFIFWNND